MYFVDTLSRQNRCKRRDIPIVCRCFFHQPQAQERPQSVNAATARVAAARPPPHRSLSAPARRSRAKSHRGASRVEYSAPQPRFTPSQAKGANPLRLVQPRDSFRLAFPRRVALLYRSPTLHQPAAILAIRIHPRPRTFHTMAKSVLSSCVNEQGKPSSFCWCASAANGSLVNSGEYGCTQCQMRLASTCTPRSASSSGTCS
jgi:hypothetical protein